MDQSTVTEVLLHQAAGIKEEMLGSVERIRLRVHSICQCVPTAKIHCVYEMDIYCTFNFYNWIGLLLSNNYIKSKWF